MLRRICLIAGLVSTLMFMTPAVAGEYAVQKHHGQRYEHVHAHRYYVRRGTCFPVAAACSAVGIGRPSVCIGSVISGEIGRSLGIPRCSVSVRRYCKG
jgi:hypothetical protein